MSRSRPILDILTLNVSHYKTYAQLEHGRFYTANPIYYVSGAGEEDTEYHIGPSVVWEIGQRGKGRPPRIQRAGPQEP
jgi:hypothetical protein